MSRTLPAVLLSALAWPAAAFAQAGLPEETRPLPQTGTRDQPVIVTADEAIAIAGTRMRDMVATVCPQNALDDEVVVCGRRPGYQRYRIPLAEELQERGGIPPRAGDAQLYAMEANDQRCSPVGRDQMCGGGLDIIGIGFTMVRGIAQALANRD